MAPLILPLSARVGLDWASGRLSDMDLFKRAPLAPECVFVWQINSPLEWPETIARLRHWRNCGARFLVLRSNIPSIIKRCEKHGARLVYSRPPADQRFLVAPEPFNAWLEGLPNTSRHPPV